MALKRNLNMDLTRCVAVFSVLSVHFFLKSGFYNNPVIDAKMFFLVVIRTLFMICVPLFLLITGYLSSQKEVEFTKNGLKSFYSKLISIVLTYVLITIVILLWEMFYNKIDLTLKNSILVITDYIYYSWYVEMYIGLYLLIPFLNLIWKNIGSKTGEQALVLILLVMTALPTLINIWNFKTSGWFSRPSSDNIYNDLIPEWWTGIYPITYYFIGAYIRKSVDFKKIKSGLILLLFIFFVFIFGAFNYWRSNTVNFISGEWTLWHSFQNTITAVLAFLFINSLKLDKTPKPVVFVIEWIAKLSFGTYLSSYFIDSTIYPILCREIPVFYDRLIWAPVMVLISFACSNLVSLVVYFVEKSLRTVFIRIGVSIKKKKNIIPA